MRNLPVPDHFDPNRVGELWNVDYGERANEAKRWAREYDIGPSLADQMRVGLLLIDLQNAFCLPQFELFVGGRSGTGAIDDNARLCDFIYRNLATITQIDPTLDTHTAMQIFHPIFLVNEHGEHPPPMTTISVDDVENGTWRVNPEVVGWMRENDEKALGAHLLHYCKSLRDSGKHQLMIWPYHGMLGSVGHALAPAVEEALFFHNQARRARTGFEMKGNNPITENYSVFRPEVLTGADGRPIARPNEHFAERLLRYDALIIAGQAKSHCVAWTVQDLLGAINTHDNPAALARKVYLLEDCTSSVVVEGSVDFTAVADTAFARFADAGMHLVQSSVPMKDWPDMALG